MRKITSENILNFEKHLICEEKSDNTIKKYTRDVAFFACWLGSDEVTKASVLEYKKHLCEKHSVATVNGAISSLNCFFDFMGWQDMRIKLLKMQRQIFVGKARELTKPEYERLLSVARKRKNARLYYLMQTVCSTGIRVSELPYITVSAIMAGLATIKCKGKHRTIFLPKKLCKMLKEYIRQNNIKNGSVFVTRTGKPLDRSYIWKMLKLLCEDAGVQKSKVFPHNFRHLFARTYYSLQKDIVRLADILGHSSINTTRIYTVDSGDECRRQIERLGFLRL